MNPRQFVVIAGPDVDLVLPVQLGKKLMGRYQDNPYRLNDPSVSRVHCEVQDLDGATTVTDKGGAGGVFVNGVKIAGTQALHAGDEVRIGATVLRLDAPTEGGAPIRAPDLKDAENLVRLSGRTLAHFQVGEVIGKGLTGMVFRANDAKDSRAVALKVMQPAFARDDEAMRRFVRAMKTMLPLRHPNLVALYAAGKTGPYCWMAMELVDGESLTAVIRRIGVAGMLDWRYALRVGIYLARALEYAHGRGVIHRGITPANILVRAEDKQPKLGDLMLAKALDGNLAQPVTKTGELVGDVNYMSPERTQDRADDVDGRSDLFSLGATLYALLTGKPPFTGASVLDTIARVRQADPVKPSAAQLGIAGAFEGVVLKLLAKRPEDRYQTAGEVVGELERVGKFNGVAV